MDYSVRRVGRRIQAGPAATVRTYFGPFRRGEVVDSIDIYVVQTTVLVVGETFICDIAVFPNDPGDTSAIFTANGRFITIGSPRLPTAAIRIRLPVGFEASDSERFLGVQISENAAKTIDGSIWLNMRLGPIGQ